MSAIIRNEGASWDDEKGAMAVDPDGDVSEAPEDEEQVPFEGLGDPAETAEALKRFGKQAQPRRPDGTKCPGGYAYFHKYKSCRRPTVVGRGALFVEESGNVKIGRWMYEKSGGKLKRGAPKKVFKKSEVDTRPARERKKALALGCPSKVAIGEVATTYASLASCPVTCPLLGYGCYGNGGMVMMTSLELNESCVSAKQCALDEAAAIRAFLAKGGLKQRGAGKYRIPPLRLHTVGDCATEENARIVCAAVDEYIEAFYQQPGFSMLAGNKDTAPLPRGVDRYGLLEGAAPCWGYTHAWREIPREAWGRMSILASCNSTAEVLEAAARGYYATSLVVPLFSQLFGVAGPRYDCNPYQGMKIPRGRRVEMGGYTLMESVCPAQVYDHVSCSNCQLCYREPFWQQQQQQNRELRVILLEVHGTEEDNAAEVAAGALETGSMAGLGRWEF